MSRQKLETQYGTKGQLISKGLFGILNSSKKRMTTNQPEHSDTKGDILRDQQYLAELRLEPVLKLVSLLLTYLLTTFLFEDKKTRLKYRLELGKHCIAAHCTDH